ncbi:MAG: hypothetical protein QXX99_07110 [Candidatus Bathyarchaeia archaeon]
MGAPPIAFYCSGKYIGSIVGFILKPHLKHIIEDIMERYRKCVK